MKNVKQFLPWAIRIGVSILFLLSAVAKLYPKPYFALSTFEAQQLIPMGFSENLAAYFSRILIGIEFSLGILLLLPFFLKRIVVPAAGLMLLVFIVHLSIELGTTGNGGNCGCFGSLLPMTPLQALIKNVISVAFLGLLFKLLKSDDDKRQFLPIVNVILASILLVFMFGMKKSNSISNRKAVIIEAKKDSTNVELVDNVSADTLTKRKVQDSIKAVKNQGPKKIKSGYASIFPNIDEGRKILCFFAPDCDHCRATSKLLTSLKKTVKNFPEIQIIFMDEAPETIPDFFQFSGSEYSNYVMDIREFWKSIGKDGELIRDVPGVLYLWNGNIQKFYYGTEDKQFDAKGFKKILAKEK